MTLPAPWRRSTAKQRRANREHFRQIKAACAAAPSEAMVKYKAKNLRNAQRQRAKKTLNAALAGRAVRPFTDKMLPTLRADELALLRAEVANRVGALTEAERALLQENSWMLALGYDVADMRALAMTLPT